MRWGSEPSLTDRALAALNVPLLKFLGPRFGGWTDGKAVVLLDVGPNTLNANDKLHAGALCALLDIVAYLAVLPTLEPPETAVTHSMNAVFFGASSRNDSLRFEGQIVHRGRSIAFVESEARNAEKRIALATVCKSILVLRGS